MFSLIRQLRWSRLLQHLRAVVPARNPDSNGIGVATLGALFACVTLTLQVTEKGGFAMVALSELEDAQIPGSFPVSLITELRPLNNPWTTEQWQVVGVTVGDAADQQVRKILDQDGVQRFQHPGFQLALHVDECESYYYNLLAERPRCYIVADLNGINAPYPQLVSVSFDEAHAYLEGEQEIYAVDMPPEIYRWVETFVLVHYVKERKRKRKRTDWKQSASEVRPN
jgi:hypothetical protein